MRITELEVSHEAKLIPFSDSRAVQPCLDVAAAGFDGPQQQPCRQAAERHPRNDARRQLLARDAAPLQSRALRRVRHAGGRQSAHCARTCLLIASATVNRLLRPPQGKREPMIVQAGRLWWATRAVAKEGYQSQEA